MMFLKITFPLILLLNCRSFAEVKVAQSDVPTVLSELLLDYDPSARPGSEGHATHVNLSIHYGYVGYRNNELTATIFLRQHWQDERLRFKTPSVIKVRSDKVKNRIWTPDTFSPDVTSMQDMNEGFISITNEGAVKWSHLLKFKSSCIFNVEQAWRTDGKQNCSIAFSSYAYKSEEVDYHWLGAAGNCVTGGPEHPDSRSKVVETYCHDDVIRITVGSFSRVAIDIEIQTPFNRKVLEMITADAVDKMSH